jgi:hypothetical protein
VRRRQLPRKALAVSVLSASAVAGIASPALAAGGGTGGSGSPSRPPLRLRALHWAEHQTGKWYCWGGTGPSCFDCSGLVMEAYRHEGVILPRTTYEMLDSRKLRRVPWKQMRPGDLAFFGSGHVELVNQPRYDRTFGAHDTGQRINSQKWNGYWHPTAFYKVVG